MFNAFGCLRPSQWGASDATWEPRTQTEASSRLYLPPHFSHKFSYSAFHHKLYKLYRKPLSHTPSTSRRYQMNQTDKPTTVYWLEDTLYLNITNQCPNHCWFCFKNYKQGVGGFNLKHKSEPEKATVIAELQTALAARHWREAVFCGFGEPTARLNLLLEVAKWLRQQYPTLPVRLDTNGQAYALNPDVDVAKELKQAGVSRVSVSLNGYDQATYAENCRPTCPGAYQEVLNFTRKAKAVGLEVEVSAVRMPENDLEKIRVIADGLGVPFRIREYSPCFH
jgi:GTP 3',8-cyclase